MFISLKKKIQQGVAQSKAVVTGLTKGDDSSEDNTVSDTWTQPMAESTPQKDAGHGKSLVEDFNTPVFSVMPKSKRDLNASSRQLQSIPLSEGSSSTLYETASDVSSLQGDVTPKENRSRTSSVSSLISDSTFFPSINLSSSFSVQSDNESEMDDTSLNLSSASREDLYSFIKRFEQNAFKYKSKCLELATAYRDSIQERDRLKSALAHCKDESLRQASELDQLTKYDLEERYRLLLADKDEYTKALQMQVQFLKEGKDIPEDLEADLLNKQTKAESALPTSGGADKGTSSLKEEIESLNSRIKRQDGLLQKCKNTITSYKEKIVQLSKDKDELHGKLELLSKTGDRTNSSDQVSRLQAQMHEARKVIEQLEVDREVSIAEFKQQIHEEMEQKDAELEHVKVQHQKCVGENHNLKLEIERLTIETEDLRRINQEQLEKARSIMRKLKDDKKLALEQAEARIRQAELSMEEEKEKMLVDLKRGKAEAFSVMQQESEKNLAEKVEAAVEERDRLWKRKMAAQEAAHLEVLHAKDREKEKTVATMQKEVRHRMKEKEEDVKLALEERELQKMAALTGLDEQKDRLLLQIEELSSENIKLSNRFSKFQEDTGHQIAELEDRLKLKEAEHNRHIHEMKLSQAEALEKEKSKMLQKVTDEIESLKQRHAEEIQDLADKHELEMQETSTELESYYRSQLEGEKLRLGNLLAATKDQEMRNQTKLLGTELLLDKAEEHQANRTRHQDLPVAIHSTEQESQPSSGGEGHVKITENHKDQESGTVIQSKTLEESNLELSLVCKALSDELNTLKEDLAAARNKAEALRTPEPDGEHQQMVEHSGNGGERSNDQEVQELRKQISELNEEHERLERNAEGSRNEVEELQRCLEEAMVEKKVTESKSREFELQVGQLQEVIRALESCQNTVEREKASLEQKLTFLENIVDDLKASKEEMNEKLHDRHDSLVQQFQEEKQTLENTVSELSSHVGVLKEEVTDLSKALLSKNDENVALRSVVEDNVGLVKSLEATIEKLNAEMQVKSQASSQSEAALAKSLEKFDKLKTEANVKVKGLKEMKDSLTEELNKQQQECEDMRNSLLEKDSQIKAYEEKVAKQQEEIGTLEQTFKEQFDKHRAKFKDVVSKLKEQHENELKGKEKQLETRLESTLQTSSDIHSQGVEDISLHIQQISELQQQLADKDSSIQNVQAELDSVVVQVKEMSDRHKMETDTLSLQLADKDVQIEHLTTRLESLHKQPLPERNENLPSQIQSLTELLTEKEKKLESMAGTISAEQESLYKQLSWQTERAEEFHAQKNALTMQLKEAVEMQDALHQDKEALLSEVNQKMVEYASLKEMLTTAGNASLQHDTDTRSLQELLQEFTAEQNSRLHVLESQLETKDNSITVLEEELNNLRDFQEQELADASYGHSKEIGILKSDWDSQITELQAATQALKSQLKEADEKLQECIQSYEDKLVEEKLQLERQERVFQEEILVLKQQLNETKNQAAVSSSLLQNAKEGEEKLFSQLQNEIKTQEQDAEQKLIDLKQKYTARLKEIQTQAKKTIEDLENTLQAEKADKGEMYSELTRANTRLLQLEENTGSSKDTIVDLERKVVEMTAMIESRDRELAKLRTDMAESERNMQEILDETQVNCKQINDKLAEAETKLKEDESHQQVMNDQLQTKLELLEKKDTVVKHLENKYLELENVFIQEKEKFERETQETNKTCLELQSLLEKARDEINEANIVKLMLLEEKDTIVKDLERKCLELESISFQEKEKLEQEREEAKKKCLELESLIEKTRSELDEANSKFTVLDYKVVSASSLSTELENVQAEKAYLQAELSQLTAEREEFKSRLHVTRSTFEKSLKEHASLVRELESRRSEAESHREELRQDCETRLNQLRQAQAAELLEMETQSSSKVAEYKKKAETYIVEVRQKFQDEYAILFDKQQENITKLEETISKLEGTITNLEGTITELKETVVAQKLEISELKQSKETLAEKSKIVIQDLKSKVEEAMKMKDTVTEQFYQKEQQFEQAEQTLRQAVEKLEAENRLLSNQLSARSTSSDDGKVQFTSMTSANDKGSELLGSDEDEERTTLNAALADTTQNSHQITLEKQEKEQMKEAEHGKKRTHLKEKEFEAKQGKAEGRSKSNEQKLNDQNAIRELRKEISEKDKHIQELHAEYQSKIQETFGPSQTALQEQVTLLTRHIEEMKKQHKLELAEITSRLEVNTQQHSQPLASTPAHLYMDVFNSNFSPEMHDLELQNMDLQAQVAQLNGELSTKRIKERDLLRKKESQEHGRNTSDDDDPPLSLDESFMNHSDLAVFREPTEFEYLKNILYEYMMGRETQTLTKVISTVVKFSDEQMKNVLAKADKKVVRKP